MTFVSIRYTAALLSDALKVRIKPYVGHGCQYLIERTSLQPEQGSLEDFPMFRLSACTFLCGALFQSFHKNRDRHFELSDFVAMIAPPPFNRTHPILAQLQSLQSFHATSFSEQQAERLQRLTRIGLAHQAFADEESVEACLAQPGDVGGAGDAALGNANTGVGDAVDQFEGRFKPDLKGVEIAVVDADGFGRLGEGEHYDRVRDGCELRRGTSQLQVVCHADEVFHVLVAERSGNEQDRVRLVRPCFEYLVLIDNEVLGAGRAAIQPSEASSRLVRLP